MTRPTSIFTHTAKANCEGCAAIWHGRNAMELAEAHAGLTGHHVIAEVLTRTHWNEDAMAPEVAAAVDRAREIWRDAGITSEARW